MARIETPEPKVAPAILFAQKLIQRNGWVRGALCTTDGYCITGAIIAATTDMLVQELAFEVIREECGRRIIVRWNDEVATSKKEVVRMLGRAAISAKRLCHAPV